MNIQHLRYFAAMMETRSVSRAAERLGISQPTLSAALKKLEREFGTRLFTPSGRGLKALPAAEKLACHVQTALRSLAEARSEIDGRSRQALRIGLIPSLAHAWLGDLLDCFEGAVEIQEAMPETLSACLTRGTLDLALTMLPEDWSADGQVLYREPYRLFFPQGHPRTQNPAVGVDALCELPFVLRQSCEQSGTAIRMLEALHIRLDIIGRTDQEAMAARLVALGRGATLAPAGWGYPDIVPVVVEGLKLSRLVGLAWQGRSGQRASELLLQRIRMKLTAKSYPSPRSTGRRVG